MREASLIAQNEEYTIETEPFVEPNIQDMHGQSIFVESSMISESEKEAKADFGVQEY